MFQRPPQQRRTLNSVNQNSAYLNHNYQSQPQQHQQPGSPMDVSYGAPPPPPPPNQYHQYHNSGGSGSGSGSGSATSPKSRQRQQQQRRHSSGGGVPCLFFLVWTGLLVGGGYIYFKFFLLPELVTDVTKDEVEHTKHHWMTKYHNLQLVHEAMEKTNQELKAKLEQQNDADSRQLQEVNQILDQERTWSLEWKQKAIALEESEGLVKRNIQEYSKRLLIQKYGYRELAVEMELNFGDTGESAWITIEMAPMDEMPHTIYTFLEQVSMGLYDDGGYAFHHNGNHIIMGSPEVNHLTPQDMDPLQRFTDSGMASVLFQEYSYEFPHTPYTIGFAGRPGGPGFYVNTQDNSNLHGPNGYAQDGSADPCFGSVTRGQDVIDRIHTMTGELQQDDWKQIETPVAVRWIKVLN